ncbi:hypothetical protein Ancab_026617 [Ancistrocladus abbreviatus]
MDRVPDKVASEGIKSLLTAIHSIMDQQAEEHRQKNKSETANKELEKRAAEIQSLEVKYGPFSVPEMSSSRRWDPVAKKRAKVEFLKTNSEEGKHEKSMSGTRTTTLSNLQTGLPICFRSSLVSQVYACAPLDQYTTRPRSGSKYLVLIGSGSLRDPLLHRAMANA